MTLSSMFLRCISRSYLRAPGQIDYAIDLIGDHLYIYFQDSDGALDWIRNFNFLATAVRRIREPVWYAHRGFLAAWRSVENKILPMISDESVRRITVVGYSHGAALALLCHEAVWYHRPDLRMTSEGYGFGCPRVLWGRPPQDISARWRKFTVIRNVDDIVTHVPPRVLGYVHVGKMLTVGTAGKYSAVDAHRPQSILKELHICESHVDRTKTVDGANF